jgi:tetratricopeptide (TPR) repeat protein
MRRSLSVLALLTIPTLVVTLAGCPKDAPSASSEGAASSASAKAKAKAKAKPEAKDSPAAPSDADETAASAAPSAGKQAAAKKAEPPKKSAPKALSADETKALASYRKALEEGRKATRDKKFADAVLAFDKALVAVPDDARAYGERGYAHILAKDFKPGLADLDKAAAHTGEKKLLAMVWFNYGLAAEGLGDAEKARAAFARSNALNPTKAAKDKIAGKLACAATFDEAGDGSEQTFDDWKSAYEAVRKDEETLPAWAGDASPKAMCGDDWKRGEPCLHHSPDIIIATADLYVQTAGGKVVRRQLDLAGGRCGGTVDAKFAGNGDGVVHVRVASEQGISVYVGVNKAGEIVDCQDGMECQSACAEPMHSFHDLFVDAATGKVLLDVVREAKDGDKDPLTVNRAGKLVDVKGAGCDRSLTLTTTK